MQLSQTAGNAPAIAYRRRQSDRILCQVAAKVAPLMILCDQPVLQASGFLLQISSDEVQQVPVLK